MKSIAHGKRSDTLGAALCYVNTLARLGQIRNLNLTIMRYKD